MRDDEIDRLLENWARWKITGSSHGRSLSPYPIYNLAIIDRQARRDYVPILNGEAEDIDAIIKDLPPRYARAINEYYLWTGTIDHKARRLNVCENTFRTWLAKGKELIREQRSYLAKKKHCAIEVFCV